MKILLITEFFSPLRVKQPLKKSEGIPDTAKQKRNALSHKIKVKYNTNVLKDDRIETLVLLVGRGIQTVTNTASHPGPSHTQDHHLY